MTRHHVVAEQDTRASETAHAVRRHAAQFDPELPFQTGTELRRLSEYNGRSLHRPYWSNACSK